MYCWWMRSYILNLLNLWAPACQEDEEQEFGTMDSVSWTRGVMFISILDTCKAHSLYFSLFSAWINKVIKDTDDLKQAGVRKNAKKTTQKRCDKTMERGREHRDLTEGNTVTGGDWRHTCSTLEETGAEQPNRRDERVLWSEGNETPLKNRKRRREHSVIRVNMWNYSTWNLQNKSSEVYSLKVCKSKQECP